MHRSFAQGDASLSAQAPLPDPQLPPSRVRCSKCYETRFGIMLAGRQIKEEWGTRCRPIHRGSNDELEISRVLASGTCPGQALEFTPACTLAAAKRS